MLVYSIEVLPSALSVLHTREQLMHGVKQTMTCIRMPKVDKRDLSENSRHHTRDARCFDIGVVENGSLLSYPPLPLSVSPYPLQRACSLQEVGSLKQSCRSSPQSAFPSKDANLANRSDYYGRAIPFPLSLPSTYHSMTNLQLQLNIHFLDSPEKVCLHENAPHDTRKA